LAEDVAVVVEDRHHDMDAVVRRRLIMVAEHTQRFLLRANDQSQNTNVCLLHSELELKKVKMRRSWL
jgi:hypothetical protein